MRFISFGLHASDPLPDGVSANHPAFANAPAYYEVGLPTGAWSGQAPRGVVLHIHGGAWYVNGRGSVQLARGEADRWRARGFETLNITYRACGNALNDVIWFYDKARAWFGPGAKICAAGGSAGGNLALTLAAWRPDVYCVVSEAGPTDLTTLQEQVAYNSATGVADQTNGGRVSHNLAAAAFGEENLSWFSPALQAGNYLKSTRVLQGFSAADAVIPYQQATELADAMRAANPAAYVDSVQLAAGDVVFMHARVSQSALDDFYAREESLVAPITAPTVALDKR